MWRSKGTTADEVRVFLQLARDRMNLRCLQSLLQREWRKDGRNSFRKHGLPGARRTDENCVVSASSCDLQCSLDVFLTFHIREVYLEVVLRMKELLAGVNLHFFETTFVLLEERD